MSGQPRPRDVNLRNAWRVVPVGLLLIALVACSESPVATTSIPSTTTPVSSTPATTSTSAPTTTSVNETTTTARSIEEEVSEGWDSFWAAWVQVRASDELDPGPLEAVADQRVVDDAMAEIGRQQASSGPVETHVVRHPNVVMVTASEASVEDCVLLTPSFAESTGVWYEADLRADGVGWVVAGLRIRSLDGCVPAALGAAALDAYEDYYEAVKEFWDPPAPDHPLLVATMTEPRLSSIRALLEEHVARGVAFRSDPTTHPEIIEVRSSTEVVILDCYEPDLGDGLYDMASGERLADEPPVHEGQTNLRSAVMVLEDGKWKASDFQGQVDFACESAPTEQGLPSI